jgi:uncharacterized protein YkwD
MRSKARWLLLLVVVPVIVLGAVATVGRSLLDDGADASNTVALTGPVPRATGEASADAGDPDAEADAEESVSSGESSPSSTSRVEAQRSKPSATKSASASKPSTAAPAKSSFASQVIKLTNRERAKSGCKPLKSNSLLKSAAQAHSGDMAKKDYFSHTGKDGRSPFDRMTDAGYSYTAAAENIAAGQRTPADVVKGWMNSAGHKKNILNCTYTEIGVGYAKGGSYGTYWTQDFGKPA